MPAEVSGNAVASLKNGIEVYSLMGIGTKKTWDDISNKMYVLRFKTGKWTEGRAVPGVAGRLGFVRDRSPRESISFRRLRGGWPGKRIYRGRRERFSAR